MEEALELDEALLEQAERRARAEGISLAQLLEAALRRYLARGEAGAESPAPAEPS